MSKPVISIQGLGKEYQVGGKAFWALRDITLDVNQGEVVGIVGRNGAGKTTLLRILSRITDPTTGHATVRGRVSTLLETGTGFHPDLTGRENVFLNGAILGMRPDEIRRRMDEIADFSGVGKFIDAPLKTYSSGMRSRLTFSVAAHLESEVLLIDEVLAVGDVAFQEKCLAKIDDLTREASRTVLFVSHSMGAIQSLCSSAVLIENGTIIRRGPAEQIVSSYNDLLLGPQRAGDMGGAATDRKGSGAIRLVGMHVESLDGALISSVPSGRGARVVFDYESFLDRPSEVVITPIVLGSKGFRLFGLPSDTTHVPISAGRGGGQFVCTLPRVPLLPGNYDLEVSVMANGELADKLESVCKISVSNEDYFGTGRLQQGSLGDGLVDFEWTVRSPSAQTS